MINLLNSFSLKCPIRGAAVVVLSLMMSTRVVRYQTRTIITVEEIIHSEDETLTKLFASMKKENVVCLLRETLSQLRSAVKQNENVGSSILQLVWRSRRFKEKWRLLWRRSSVRVTLFMLSSR